MGLQPWNPFLTGSCLAPHWRHILVAWLRLRWIRVSDRVRHAMTGRNRLLLVNEDVTLCHHRDPLRPLRMP